MQNLREKERKNREKIKIFIIIFFKKMNSRQKIILKIKCPVKRAQVWGALGVLLSC
jgi:hypothetical protein